MTTMTKWYDNRDIRWSDKLTDEDKEVLFQAMPDIWVSNDDGTRTAWRFREGVWTWKHLSNNGLVLAEGEGGP